MEIILINYPYKDYEVGDVVDLGEKKNESMVAMGRAVWYVAPKGKPKKKRSSTKGSKGKPKKKRSSTKGSKKRGGGEKSEFWDKI